MRENKKIAQKICYTDIPLMLSGPGKINTDSLINIAESTFPTLEAYGERIPLTAVPQQFGFSHKIGKTIYDVTTHFDTDGKESLLHQFKTLILSQTT